MAAIGPSFKQSAALVYDRPIIGPLPRLSYYKIPQYHYNIWDMILVPWKPSWLSCWKRPSQLQLGGIA